MNFSRRGLLKGAPAAAVAGGMAVQKIAQEKAWNPIPSTPGLAGLINTASPEAFDPVEHVTHMLRHHAREKEDLLKRSKENAQRTSISVSAQRIDSLKSVSATYKAEMRERAEAAYHVRNELNWIDRRVEELRKEFPLLSYLFKDWK